LIIWAELSLSCILSTTAYIRRALPHSTRFQATLLIAYSCDMAAIVAVGPSCGLQFKGSFSFYLIQRERRSCNIAASRSWSFVGLSFNTRASGDFACTRCYNASSISAFSLCKEPLPFHNLCTYETTELNCTEISLQFGVAGTKRSIWQFSLFKFRSVHFLSFSTRVKKS